MLKKCINLEKQKVFIRKKKNLQFTNFTHTHINQNNLKKITNL